MACGKPELGILVYFAVNVAKLDYYMLKCYEECFACSEMFMHIVSNCSLLGMQVFDTLLSWKFCLRDMFSGYQFINAPFAMSGAIYIFIIINLYCLCGNWTEFNMNDYFY